MKRLVIKRVILLKDSEGKLPRHLSIVSVDSDSETLPVLLALSKPVNRNLKKVSGIKDGLYKSSIRKSANNIPYEHIKVGVPDREYISIFGGTSCSELDGHFLVGQTVTFDGVYQMYDLTKPKESLQKLIGYLRDSEFEIEVKTSPDIKTIKPKIINGKFVFIDNEIDILKFKGYHSFLFDQTILPSYGEFYRGQ